jgi:hypothetical protein
MWAHCLFVMKYWIVSKKVEHFHAGKNDPNFECKTKSLMILLFAVTSTACLMAIFGSYDMYHGGGHIM